MDQSQKWSQQLCLPPLSLVRAMLSPAQRQFELNPTVVEDLWDQSTYNTCGFGPPFSNPPNIHFWTLTLLLCLTYSWKPFRWPWLKQAVRSWAIHQGARDSSGRCWKQSPEKRHLLCSWQAVLFIDNNENPQDLQLFFHDVTMNNLIPICAAGIKQPNSLWHYNINTSE